MSEFLIVRALANAARHSTARHPPAARFSFHHAGGEPTLATVNSLLWPFSWAVRSAIGRFSTAEWPYTAAVYRSPTPDGVAPPADRLLEWPAKLLVSRFFLTGHPGVRRHGPRRWDLPSAPAPTARMWLRYWQRLDSKTWASSDGYLLVMTGPRHWEAVQGPSRAPVADSALGSAAGKTRREAAAELYRMRPVQPLARVARVQALLAERGREGSRLSRDEAWRDIVEIVAGPDQTADDLDVLAVLLRFAASCPKDSHTGR